MSDRDLERQELNSYTSEEETKQYFLDRQDAERWRKLKQIIDSQELGTRLSLWVGEFMDGDKIVYIQIEEEIHSYADRETNFDSLIDVVYDLLESIT